MLEGLKPVYSIALPYPEWRFSSSDQPFDQNQGYAQAVYKVTYPRDFLTSRKPSM